MTTLEALHCFDSVPPEKRPQGVPKPPGVDVDLLFSPYMVAGVRLTGRLEECSTTWHLEAALVEFNRMLKAKEISKADWCAEALRIIGEFMLACEEHLADQQAIAESN